MGTGIREQGSERPSLPYRQTSEIFPRPPRGDGIELLDGRRTDHIKDEFQLMTVVSSREKRTATKALSEDATHSPDVYRLVEKWNQGLEPRPITRER